MVIVEQKDILETYNVGFANSLDHSITEPEDCISAIGIRPTWKITSWQRMGPVGIDWLVVSRRDRHNAWWSWST